MNKTSAQRNQEALIKVAMQLGDLCSDITFVGGGILGLLITDKAAPDVRFTLDVDCIIDLATRIEYYALEDKLRQKGFKQALIYDHPICRWHYDDILLDVVPTEKSILGFANQWYKDAITHSRKIKLNKFIEINVISAPYFLATKLEAFKDRGKNDFLLSHDMEDIISILDGRIEIINDIAAVDSRVINYLAEEFNEIISNKLFLQALPGHLNYSIESMSRQTIVEGRIKEIIGLAHER